jgi:hypothetical protein
VQSVRGVSTASTDVHSALMASKMEMEVKMFSEKYLPGVSLVSLLVEETCVHWWPASFSSRLQVDTQPTQCQRTQELRERQCHQMAPTNCLSQAWVPGLQNHRGEEPQGPEAQARGSRPPATYPK